MCSFRTVKTDWAGGLNTVRRPRIKPCAASLKVTTNSRRLGRCFEHGQSNSKPPGTNGSSLVRKHEVPDQLLALASLSEADQHPRNLEPGIQFTKSFGFSITAQCGAGRKGAGQAADGGGQHGGRRSCGWYGVALTSLWARSAVASRSFGDRSGVLPGALAGRP